MDALQVRPFEGTDLAAAGRLLAERHRRHRSAMPLLSPTYEDASAAQDEVAKAWAGEHSSGAVAVRGSETVGYLLGAPKGDTWGPNVWVEAAGQAAEDAETMRDLFALACGRWYAEGRLAQYVLVPAQDRELVDAWFRLGFGQQHAHGIRRVPQHPSRLPERVTVRQAVRSDIPMLARLDLALPEHQGQSPVFSAGSMPTPAEAEAEWEEDFDDDAYTTFVAEVDGHVVGSTITCALDKSPSYIGPVRADNAGFLGFAAVLPQSRGLGAGRALGEAVMAWSRDRGFDSVVADWRTTNLLSSRTWEALGFEPYFLRLHRLIGY
jgi:ribosomal protein S18 acetylase RimI-like enzyme